MTNHLGTVMFSSFWVYLCYHIITFLSISFLSLCVSFSPESELLEGNTLTWVISVSLGLPCREQGSGNL